MFKNSGLFVVAALACTLSVEAASFTFNVQYFGGGVTALGPGSDNPAAVNLQPGDSFDWRFTAQNSAFWQVNVSRPYDFLMAFSTDPTAERVGDFTFELRKGGSTVFTQIETGASNRYIHVGTNRTNLTAGLQFDELFLSYTLTSATFDDPVDPTNPLNGTPVGTPLFSPLPIFGAPEVNATSIGSGGIEYVTTVIPEPGTWALLLTGGALAAIARRRR